MIYKTESYQDAMTSAFARAWTERRVGDPEDVDVYEIRKFWSGRDRESTSMAFVLVPAGTVPGCAEDEEVRPVVRVTPIKEETT
jgi:hypothetical protein